MASPSYINIMFFICLYFFIFLAKLIKSRFVQHANNNNNLIYVEIKHDHMVNSVQKVN